MLLKVGQTINFRHITGSEKHWKGPRGGGKSIKVYPQGQTAKVHPHFYTLMSKNKLSFYRRSEQNNDSHSINLVI